MSCVICKIETFLYHADVGWFKNISRKAILGLLQMLKPKSFRGAAPGPPTGALERAPGPHDVRRSAFMNTKLLALTRRTNTKFVPKGLILTIYSTIIVSSYKSI